MVSTLARASIDGAVLVAAVWVLSRSSPDAGDPHGALVVCRREVRGRAGVDHADRHSGSARPETTVVHRC